MTTNRRANHHRMYALVLLHTVGLGHAFQKTTVVTSSSSTPLLLTMKSRLPSSSSVLHQSSTSSSGSEDDKNSNHGITTFPFFQSVMKKQQQSQQPRRGPKRALVQGKPTGGKRQPRAVNLKHERDFFRQTARLESMDSYVLVSTLTASMSFGALLGFQPSFEAVVASASSTTSSASLSILAKTALAISSFLPIFKVWLYQVICAAIPVVAGRLSVFYVLDDTVVIYAISQQILNISRLISPTNNIVFFFRRSRLIVRVSHTTGFSAILGLYSTIIFSLTILYGKAALGGERDLEYEKFLRRTVRPRVHGARCFTLSLGLFMVEAFLVLIERTYHRPWFLCVFGTTVAALFYLYRDWRLTFRMAEYIYRD